MFDYSLSEIVDGSKMYHTNVLYLLIFWRRIQTENSKIYGFKKKKKINLNFTYKGKFVKNFDVRTELPLQIYKTCLISHTFLKLQ